jgi:hypothetical protein
MNLLLIYIPFIIQYPFIIYNTTINQPIYRKQHNVALIINISITITAINNLLLIQSRSQQPNLHHSQLL